MNKHVLVLAALTAAAGAAWSQSSVTVYGRLDLGVGKPLGTADKQVMDAAGSRLGFRGTEDLGGGLRALFGFEHRFNPDTGVANATFWQGYSTVGLGSPYGRVNLGRQYTPAFSLIQNQIDPFGGDTVAQVRDVGMRVGGVTKVRVADSIRYDHTFAGVNVAASVAESTQPGASAGPDRPISVAANYQAGPFFVGAGYEDPAGANDKQWNVGARYELGSLTLSAGYARATTAANADAKGYVLGARYVIGATELMAAYGLQKVAGATVSSKLGLGVHHNLSKRTKLYADLGRDTKLATQKAGFDLGIFHNF